MYHLHGMGKMKSNKGADLLYSFYVMQEDK
jgi:hypothetical protein